MKTKIIHLEEVDSTNRFLHDYTPAADEEMTVVTARYQSAGRGQGSNKWESSAGDNLLLSILVHPFRMPLTRQFLLSEAGALALKEALDNYTDGISVKWPNDIYWRDRKISGTLIETRVNGGRMKDFIFGSGININQREFRSDAPNPVSLRQIIGHETPVEEVFGRVLTAFTKYNGMIVNGEYDAVAALYHEVLYRRHGFHAYRDQDGDFDGALVEVEDDGHLILRDRTGVLRSYAFKEVEYIIPPTEDATSVPPR